MSTNVKLQGGGWVGEWMDHPSTDPAIYKLHMSELKLRDDPEFDNLSS